jgi:hypothetical protein
MDIRSIRQKWQGIFTALLLTLFSLPAYAAPGAAAAVPAEWVAKPPIHINKVIGPELAGPQGFSPAQIRQAYGFTNTYQGAGQIIAIVDAYDDPNIEADLGVFSAQVWVACLYNS